MSQKKKQLRVVKKSKVGLAIAVFLSCLSPHALRASHAVEASIHQIAQSQRLSSWLSASPAGVNDGWPRQLHWLARSQKPLQEEERRLLVAMLKGRYSALAGMLSQLPITGRVPLKSTDGRWMEVNPVFDPVLNAGDSVAHARRSDTVATLLPSGHVCLVPFQAGASLLGYLSACGVKGAERVWVVQPDGRVIEQGVAAWNESPQTEAAPGAWIWATTANENFTEEESRRLTRFLSTQIDFPTNYPWRQQRQLTSVPRQGETSSEPRRTHLTSNDWGAVGLLQTPSARMEQVGAATLMYNRTVPYSALKARLQPVEWLSFAFGYVSVTDMLYGPASLSGDQSYKDKSADLKLRVWSESEWLPEVAVGWRDLVGTGFFTSEYIVASKRFWGLDASAGLAFGYMAGSHDMGNPFGGFSSRFRTRPASGSSEGGKFNAKSFFRGPVAFFGGLQYQLPSTKWLLKLEYESNDYTREPAGRPIRQDSPFNVGLVYRFAPWLDLTAGFERGNRAMFTVSAHTQLDGLSTPKYLDRRPLPVRDAYPAKAAAAVETARGIESQTDASVARISSDGLRMTVTLANPEMGYARPLIDRVAAVTHRDAPASVETIAVRMAQRGVAVAEIEVDRQEWVKQKTQYVPPTDRKETLRTVAVPAAVNIGEKAATPSVSKDQGILFDNTDSKSLSYGLGLNYRQNLGGPDGFLLYHLAADVTAEWRLRPDTWVSGTARLRLLDNYDNFKYTADSKLPRVRTHVREYLVTERLTIPNLQLSHMGQAGGTGDHFYLFYGGLLENMFGGVGAEYLYRPVNSRFALGVDVNQVRQREFEQHFSMRDYKVNTGHVTAYWDTGISDIQLKLSAGQYLAGDRGMTADVSRMFRNGVSIGAYATKTNVSAEQFGEGSFDKGVYVNIPFDAMLPRSGSGQASIVYAPLIRDGGAKLARRFNLFEMTRARDPRALDYGAPTAPND